MNYEKKYKDATNWMRDIYPTLKGADKEDAEHYFPELAESEDEKIRKEIRDYFAVMIPGACQSLSDKYSGWIAWLEKQKEKADKRLEMVELHCKEVQEFDKKIKALRKEWYGEEQKEQKVDIDKLRRDIYQSGYNDGYQHGREDEQKEQKPAELEQLAKLRGMTHEVIALTKQIGRRHLI